MFKKINNEKGIALVLALVVLVALTLMGIAALMTSSLDTQIAANERTAIQSQYAAEAGLAEAIARLNLGNTDADYAGSPPTGTNWPVTWAGNDGIQTTYKNWKKGFGTTISSTDSTTFFNYSVSVSFKPWVGNKVAFYNHTCGYNKSTFITGGQPVYYVKSKGKSGDYRSAVVLEITKDAYSYNIKGGFTANGGVDLRGNPTVDGTPHTETGAAGGSCSDANLSNPKPAVFANGTTDPPSSGTVVGGTATPWQRGGGTARYPWDALGITESAFNDLFANKQLISYSGSRSGELWVGGTGTVTSQSNGNKYNGTSQSIDGSGILVVHNPNFLPDNDTSVNAVGNGICEDGELGYPDFDNNTATADCYEQKAPAKLEVSKGTYKGLIVADQVSLSGNVTIIGAIISLTTILTDATGAGNPTIKYSCEAVEKYAGGKVKRKLSFNVLRE